MYSGEALGLRPECGFTPVEHWRPIARRYTVSDRGRVCGPGGIHKGWIGSHGYRSVSIGRQTRLVHRLVLEAFVGPCPQGMEACHNNGDPLDCRLSNLRWGTHASNMEDRHHHRRQRGQAHPLAKLTEETARSIKYSDAPGRVLAQRFGVSPETVCGIRKARTWRHV